MDKRRDWGFMKQHMPRVVAMLVERRAKGEGAHIDACWKRGVLNQEPGWFWAREGGVSVGAPFEDTEAAQLERMAAKLPGAAGQALLMLRPPSE